MAAATTGIKLMVGSGADGATLQHGTQAEEFVNLVKHAGVSPAKVIQAGTMTNATAMGWQDQIGSIEKGKQADFAFYDVPSLSYLPYHVGVSDIAAVVKKGNIVSGTL